MTPSKAPARSAAVTATTDLVTLLGHLVRFPTVTSDQATNRAAIDWVKYQLRDLPLQVHDYEHNGVPSTVWTTQSTKHPKLMLMAHMDVVPGAPELFTLREEQGRLYGRGVFDMKLAIAIYMKLLLELGQELKHYDLGLVITGDEEVNGNDGIGRLVKAGWRADVIMNPDAASDWDMERAAKGRLHYRLRSRGTTGHGSRPWAYKNAIVQLMACLQELRGHFQSEPCGDAGHLHDTLTISTIHGGEAFNQVPDAAEAQLDIRVMPGADALQRIKDIVQLTLSHYEDVSIAEEYVSAAFETDPDNEYFRLMEHLIASTTGHKPRHILSHGATDSRHFAGLGIPFILTRPKGGGQHAADEWVEAKGLDQMYRVTRLFAEQVAKI